jgi:hypothetical protein
MNLIPHSDSFDAAAWVKLNALVQVLSTGNPAGGLFAQRVVMSEGESTFPLYGTNVEIEAGAS